MNKLDAILRDYHRKQNRIPLAERVKKYLYKYRDIIANKYSFLLKSIGLKFLPIFNNYRANPKFHLDLFTNFQALIHYKNYDITGPKTLEELYKHFQLTKDQIEEIEEAYPFKSDIADFYGASYEYIGSFKWDLTHQDNWATFIDGIPQFHLMGNLWTLSVADDGVKMKGKNIVIYINPKNINLIKAVTTIRSIDLI